MNRKNNDLVSTKIARSTKHQLELLKALFLSIPAMENYGKSDYAALGYLLDRETEVMNSFLEMEHDNED